MEKPERRLGTRGPGEQGHGTPAARGLYLCLRHRALGLFGGHDYSWSLPSDPSGIRGEASTAAPSLTQCEPFD